MKCIASSGIESRLLGFPALGFVGIPSELLYPEDTQYG